ncbi:aspartate/glutamate racemase family protein [Reyranella aquatilis]|uniref:Aspartate/glutamate racemase family protein n=1 Tax=Reyranella aquatilis TaxID=2035356 RepID=A0ABS8L3J9_9HYPH|nr:aspartate/glutamate racemase family protein [Reyranella aquatilis]MCC8432926.1 aspartate/glutamate racemase family protein [Reyranella aquatilis]
MHIGLIAGIGPAATDFYYRGLIDRHAAAGIPLDLTMAHADVREMSRNLVAGNPTRQAEIFAGLVQRMKGAGAEAAVITSMGGHFCVKELTAISPLPVLNAIPAVDAALAKRGLRKIGILGTRAVMESHLYGGIPSVEVVPTEALDRVHDTYVAMATIGHVTEAQRQVFFEEGRRLRARGAEAIMLGGTDLFLAFAGHDPGFPVIDCADIHVDAIFATSAR